MLEQDTQFKDILANATDEDIQVRGCLRRSGVTSALDAPDKTQLTNKFCDLPLWRDLSPCCDVPCVLRSGRPAGEDPVLCHVCCVVTCCARCQTCRRRSRVVLCCDVLCAPADLQEKIVEPCRCARWTLQDLEAFISAINFDVTEIETFSRSVTRSSQPPFADRA